MRASQQITEEVGSWPGVEAGPGPRGEFGFRLDGRELGHLHGDHAAHFSFPKKLGVTLRTEGRVVDHPVFPGKPGFAARRIEDDADVRDVIELMRLNYERIRARDGTKRKHTVIRSGEMQPNEWGTIKFEGEPYGSGASFFLVNNQPGEGPGLHKHPYPETWIVRSGHARFRAGDQELKASTGDIVVVSAETPHEFKNIGSERLDIICIHPSPRIIQEDLE